MKKNFEFEAKEAGILILSAVGGAFIGAGAGKYAALLSFATIAISSGYGSTEGVAVGAGMMAGVGVQASKLNGLGADEPPKYGIDVAKSNLKIFTKGFKSSFFIPEKDCEAGKTRQADGSCAGLGDVDWELMRQLAEQNNEMEQGGAKGRPGIDSLLLSGIMSHDAMSRER